MNLKKLKSSELKAAIYGMILGDGYLALAGKRAINARLNIGHSVNQLDYLLWKKDIIEQVSSTTTKLYKNEKLNSINLFSNSRRYFTKIRNNFYINNKGKNIKVITPKILNSLTELSLAIWFMDDGSTQVRGNHIRCCLNTQSFSLDENHLIIKWLKSKYNIESRIQEENKKNGNKYFLISFNKENSIKLLNIIKPFILKVPCMHYKLGNQIHTQDGRVLLGSQVLEKSNNNSLNETTNP